MKKLLVICGPTATGKTRLAVYLSKVFDGTVISADSRQVYKYMDIGTGKEKPNGEKILGYDLIEPDEEFSVQKYVAFADKAINKTYKELKLPILVGGTGLYIKAVVDQLEKINIPRNLALREKLAKSPAKELFSILMAKSPSSAAKLNSSDRANPRRLIRLIEISDFGPLPSNQSSSSNFQKKDVLFVGLTTSGKNLRERIEKRVEERIADGFEKEVEFLKKKGFWNGAPHVTLGYRQWPDIEKWKLEEFRYAKRQMTWFKKDRRINWFDITEPDWQEKVERLVKKWYDRESRYA